MTRVKLNEFVPVTLDGSGNGTAKAGPRSARETWFPVNVHVSANTNPVKDAVCKVYVGDQATQNNFRDATISGSTGDSTDRVNADQIPLGQYIFAVWSNGDANIQGVMNITGEREI